MKIIATLSVGLFVFSASFGQSRQMPEHKAGTPDKTVIYGTVKDMRNKPMKGIKAFVYKPDSTIVASGFSNTDGYFETNGVMPGTYFVKLIYPTDKTVLIYGIEMKKSTQIIYKGGSPNEDTVIALDAIMPKIELKTGKK